MLRRPRRNRKLAVTRAHIQETYLLPEHLVYPLFLVDGKNQKEEVRSLPGNFRWSIDLMLQEIEACMELGLRSFVIFPAVEEALKDAKASYSYSDDNFYLHALRDIKERFPEACLITDVAMDPYSSDGHDGLVKDGRIVNDETLPILSRMALAQAQAGADIIGPSDMMDGRVQSIRQTLDDNAYTEVSIMSYTAKYASAFYGPFRDALDSAPKAGDKKTYQMSPANKREALIEMELDEIEGADYLMVKPALPYLDIIQLLSDNTALPVAAYNVSGECAMLLAAADKGWLDYEKAMPEMLYSIRRAGAKVILSYFAKDFAELHKAGKIDI